MRRGEGTDRPRWGRTRSRGCGPCLLRWCGGSAHAAQLWAGGAMDGTWPAHRTSGRRDAGLDSGLRSTVRSESCRASSRISYPACSDHAVGDVAPRAALGQDHAVRSRSRRAPRPRSSLLGIQRDRTSHRGKTITSLPGRHPADPLGDSAPSWAEAGSRLYSRRCSEREGRLGRSHSSRGPQSYRHIR